MEQKTDFKILNFLDRIIIFQHNSYLFLSRANWSEFLQINWKYVLDFMSLKFIGQPVNLLQEVIEMKGITKKILFVTLAAALSMAVTACSSGETLKKIEKSGNLVIGTSADYAPYDYHTVINGKDTITGIDISIAQEISKDMGVQLEIVDMGYDELLEALNADKVDIVIAGMTPDEDRKKEADFSKIYYKSEQGVLVRTGDKDKIKSIADLDGKKVGAQLGTVQEKIAKEQMKDSDLITLGKIPDLVMELKNKKIDALVVELPVANGYVKNNNDLFMSEVQVKEESEGFAIAVKKGNSELLKLIDQSLDRIIKDGSIDKFVQETVYKNVTAK
jgi:polar amino acid transport system substrate-binding protein